MNFQEVSEVISQGKYWQCVGLKRFDSIQDIDSFVIAEIKTDIPQKEAYDTEPVSQRIILHEEKGICDSREAEKDIEVSNG